MEINKLVFGGLVAGLLTAVAGGSYLAVRQNQAPIAAQAPVENAVPAAAESAPSAEPVRESEGVIAREAAPSGREPAPAPARRAPSASRAPSAASRASAPAQRAPIAARRPAAPAESPAVLAEATMARAEPAGGTMWETRPAVQPSVPDYPEPEPPPPPAPEFVEITVPSDAVLGLQIERTISSELARVEDRVDARVTRDVRVSDRIAIPAGATARGSVVDVDRGGRMKGRARLAIRFHTIVLADGTQLPLKTDAVVREGDSPGGESAAKVGGAAIGGAILGAILGGGKGAAIGAGVGAGAGTAAAMTNDPNPATLTAGTTVTVRMLSPVTVTVMKE